MSIKLRTITKILLVILALAAVFQIGTALAESGLFGGEDKPTYEQWLAAYEVHEKFKQQLEQLTQAGHSRSDLMTGFEFLYHQYGTIEQLEPLVAQKEKGSSWAALFSDYMNNHAPFEPRAFDSEQLESMTAGASLTADDIMIADRISYVSGDPVKELLDIKLESGQGWQSIAAERNIVNGSSVLRRVQITKEQMALYATDAFSGERVAEAFVLADKIGSEAEEIVASMKAGSTETAIMAKQLADKYESY